MMQVLVVRHGPALDALAAARQGVSEDERPLTPQGVEVVQRVAAALARWVPQVGGVATSPLLRARQTAELLTRQWPGQSVQVRAELRPEHDPEPLLRWLQSVSAADPVVIVGHQPDLSIWTSWMLSGHTKPFLDIARAGACLLQLSEPPRAGEGRLLWLLTPAQLQALT